jgi:hypothetical protein
VSGHRFFVARVSRLLFGSLLGAVFSGCELPPATAVAVAVKSELIAGVELGQVTYRVFEVNDDPERSKPVSEFTTAAQTLNKPFIVTRAHADEFLLSVEGFAPDEVEPVIIYRERVHFESGKTLALHVFLARACFEHVCTYGGLTCFGEAYGNTVAGDCAPIPGPRELNPVERPGDESDWDPEPTTASLIDAGYEPVQPFGPYPSVPRGDGGLDVLSCIGSRPSASRSCWPSDASTLDASYQPPLFDKE